MPQWDDITPHRGDRGSIEYLSADTEAHTLIDGVKVTTDELYALGREKTASWLRQHVTVHVYAWLLSDGRNTACFETWEAFSDFCASHRVGTVWWYNAKYDFSHIDYALLTTGWTLKDAGKLQDREYKSLHGRQGQRYSLTVAKAYRNPNRHTYTHTTKHLDLCNIFNGGLAKNLAAFNVTDFDGRPVRKLEMDYQGDPDTPEARAYMENDVVGLYHLVRVCDAFLSDKWGYRLAVAKPDVMTAGGLAKKVLLSYCNGFSRDHKENVREFQFWHKITVATDKFYRGHGLYRGGMTLCNANYQNRHVHGPIYKYDINSMYPYQMSVMPDLIGQAYTFTYAAWQARDDKDRYVAVFEIQTAYGTLRDGMLPVFYNIQVNEYQAVINLTGAEQSHLFFADEWAELNKWYDITAEISYVYAFTKAPAYGFKRFVKDNYEGKREAKRTGNKVMEAFCKLELNSSYGKLSESPYKEKSHREINPETGAVVLVEDGGEIDEKVLLSVVLGAQITSMARCQLMRLVREICPVPSRDLLYTDTDSIISLTPYAHPDAYTLGALKDETVTDGVAVPYTDAKFLAPKSYLLYRTLPDGTHDMDVHTKGLPLAAIKAETVEEAATTNKIHKDLPVDVLISKFKAGEKYIALSAMNVRGGKALVPVLKELCKLENTIITGSNEHSETLSLMEEA